MVEEDNIEISWLWPYLPVCSAEFAAFDDDDDASADNWKTLEKYSKEKLKPIVTLYSLTHHYLSWHEAQY